MAPEDETTEELLELLDLEELDTDLYRGVNERASRARPALFGGQVAAQALRAAANTVPEGRLPNSLHGYFLRPGRSDRPVILHVARDRDGGSFSSRHVVARQEGQVIFSMTSSFQTPAEGADWSSPTEPAAGPDGIEDAAGFARFASTMEVKALPPLVAYEEGEWPVPGRLWVRTRGPLPDDPVVHACALTYASDIGSGFGDGTVPGVERSGPSIDHAVWFHDGLRMDDWVLLEMWPLKAKGGRGLYAGTMQDRHGSVGAMIMQELLFRSPPVPWPGPGKAPASGTTG